MDATPSLFRVPAISAATTWWHEAGMSSGGTRAQGLVGVCACMSGFCVSVCACCVMVREYTGLVFMNVLC